MHTMRSAVTSRTARVCGGPLRALVADPTGSAILDPADEPFAGLQRNLAQRLGIRFTLPESSAPPAETVLSPTPETRTGPPTADAAVVDCTNDPAHHSLFSILARETSALDEGETLTIGEFSTPGIVIWEGYRDQNGTLSVSHRPVVPWTSLLNDRVISEDELARIMRPGASPRILLICTDPDSPRAATAMHLAGVRYPAAPALNCTTSLDEALREVIADAPLTRLYGLVGLSRSRSGRLTLTSMKLFPPGAKRDDRVTLSIECMPSDDKGTVFAVVAARTRDLSLVSLQSATVAPGSYTLTALLVRPGAVRFEGLPASLRAETRSWAEILAAVPDRLNTLQPDHLIVAVEVSGFAEQFERRIDRATQLIAVAAQTEIPAKITLISYGPHTIGIGPMYAETPTSVLIWSASSATALDVLNRLRQQGPAKVGYPFAAQIECMLALVARRLTGQEDRPALVTIGSRPAFPDRLDPTSRIIPCPEGNDWRTALDQLTEHPGVIFGAIHDGDTDADIWNRLGGDAHASLDAVDIRRFAADLGLARNMQHIPLPLVGQEGALAEPLTNLGEVVAAEASHDHSLVSHDVTDDGYSNETASAVSSTKGRPEFAVTMWGAPGSGKTTFLAALSIALNRQNLDWNISGANEASEEMLIKLTTELAPRRVFPEATLGIAEYHWVLNGSVSEIIRRRFHRERQSRPVTIGLDIIDASGEITGPVREGLFRRELLEHLIRSRGIIYTFDPVRESEVGDAFDHTFGVLNQLAQAMANESGGRLPHYLAVCITKFDDPRVFHTAEELNMLFYDSNDPYGFPRVHDEDARELFIKLCQESQNGDAELVINLFEQNFRPERIKYFVTSAIGFRTDPGSRAFDSADSQNLLPDDKLSNNMRIRGPIHPINVAEPLLWLSQQLVDTISRGSGTRLFW